MYNTYAVIVLPAHNEVYVRVTEGYMESVHATNWPTYLWWVNNTLTF